MKLWFVGLGVLVCVMSFSTGVRAEVLDDLTKADLQIVSGQDITPTAIGDDCPDRCKKTGKCKDTCAKCIDVCKDTARSCKTYCSGKNNKKCESRCDELRDVCKMDCEWEQYKK